MESQTKCVICKNMDSEIIYENYPGYVEGTAYDIHHCNNCDINYISISKLDKSIYEVIYSNENIEGYDRYLKYAKEIKSKSDPLEYLALRENTYYPVYNYLKDKDHLNVLEVGCGYGHLSYAMSQLGHKVTAIDVSGTAVEFAKKNFGDFCSNIDFNEFTENSKYDLIVSVEVIEHLIDPIKMVQKCKSLLNDNGKILLTTPNKDYAEPGTIWQTDLPPVHISWLGRKGMCKIAEESGLKASFTDFKKYYPVNENRLVKYIRARKEFIQSPLLKMNGAAITKGKHSATHDFISGILHHVSPVRTVSNYLYNKLNRDEITLGILLSK